MRASVRENSIKTTPLVRARALSACAPAESFVRRVAAKRVKWKFLANLACVFRSKHVCRIDTNGRILNTSLEEVLRQARRHNSTMSCMGWGLTYFENTGNIDDTSRAPANKTSTTIIANTWFDGHAFCRHPFRCDCHLSGINYSQARSRSKERFARFFKKTHHKCTMDTRVRKSCECYNNQMPGRWRMCYLSTIIIRCASWT